MERPSLGVVAHVVSSPLPHVGRPVLHRAAGAVRAHVRDPITRRVVAVAALGTLLAAAVLTVLAGRGAVLHVDVPTGWLLPGLVVLTCLAEITVVKLRHGDAVEELTLYEAALIVDVLLLRPGDALIAAVAGLLLASAVQRRPPVKAIFNLGTYTAAVSVLILVVHGFGGTPGTTTPGVVAGVVLGTFAFTVVNLCCLAQILAVINEEPWWAVVRAEVRLSAYMAIGTVATGLTTTVIGLQAPLLLPFMAMPALAVTYAYRAAAREADERVRSACLLRLSHALAEREDVVRQFLVLVREAFAADVAVVRLDGHPGALAVESGDPAEVRPVPVPAYLAGPPAGGPVQLVEQLPGGLRQLVVVPVEGGGHRLGTAAFGTRDRNRLSTGDITLLASLAGTLAVALRGAEHLRRLTAETSKLQAVVEQSAEGILVIDGAGTVEMWNPALTDLTGVPAADAAGRTLTELLDVPAEEERDRLVPVSVDRPRAATDLTVRRADGAEHRLRLAHSAVFTDGRMLRDVIVISDLTRQYRTERLKSDFIAMVSHELRTPLTPIIGYVDLLRRRGERMTPQKRLDALDLIGDRAAHLSRMVEDLLLASRFGDHDDVPLEVVGGSHDLTAIVTQVVTDLGSDRVTATAPGPLPARCDPGRTLQIVTNLIGNGLKYSPADRPVEVIVGADDERVYVEVHDRGRGIPADALDKVFDKFYRVEDPMTMSTGGTGLGLFIARRLARAMGGDITVTSVLGTGSVFTLSLRRP